MSRMYVNMCPYGKMTKQHSCLCFVTHNDDNVIAATIVLMINECFTTTLPDHSCFIPSQQLTFYERKVQRMCNKSKKRPMPKMPNPPLLVTSTFAPTSCLHKLQVQHGLLGNWFDKKTVFPPLWVLKNRGRSDERKGKKII